MRLTHEDVTLLGPPVERAGEVLTPEALAFVGRLNRRFDPPRRALLARRQERQAAFDRGERPGFLPGTRHVREGEWKVGPVPSDLEDRRVEITGPVDRKMMINALNSGANVFMADFEDALSPTWPNVVEGQVNLRDFARGALALATPEGRSYRLAGKTATLVVRPRGWHLVDRHVLVDGEPVAASLLDFGLHVFHNARALVERGSGPYFYLPKLEGHLEARLWNDVFVAASEELGLARGTIKATVLIETILAAFEMEEILYELRDHAVGLNAGRWDYIFSYIKRLGRVHGAVLPDRAAITMTAPFMRAYALQLVRACHRRGAHAMGGMAAFVPSRKDEVANARAFGKVREDKLREADDGFDGTWVAHPDLVPVARAVFDAKIGDAPHQKHRLREDVHADAEALLAPGLEPKVTEAGLRNNVEVALLYIEAWLNGLGAVAIHNLMEDAATAEIARAQVWQWVRRGAKLDDGRAIDAKLVRAILDEETRAIRESRPAPALQEARALLERVALAEDFVEFLTIPAYDRLVESRRSNTA
ncbi:MAG TPA: malate synthase A [Candidatus Thermoplasmatota archaeon]|nr:malate synthase A [Candidatus Thermoplasmatota archaeon]